MALKETWLIILHLQGKFKVLTLVYVFNLILFTQKSSTFFQFLPKCIATPNCSGQ